MNISECDIFCEEYNDGEYISICIDVNSEESKQLILNRKGAINLAKSILKAVDYGEE